LLCLVLAAGAVDGRIPIFVFLSRGLVPLVGGRARSCDCALVNFKDLSVGEFFAEQCNRRLLAISLDSNVVPSCGFTKNSVKPKFHDDSLKDPIRCVRAWMNVKTG
jgi:hypothetical protein